MYDEDTSVGDLADDLIELAGDSEPNPDPTCPFCGNAMKLEIAFNLTNDMFSYRCSFCESTTGFYDDSKYAYKAANKRAEATWILHQFDKECSHCHGYTEFGNHNYCPNCGRKMTSSKSASLEHYRGEHDD